MKRGDGDGSEVRGQRSVSPGACKGGEAAGGAAKDKGRGRNEAGDPQERYVCVSGEPLRQIIALLRRGSGTEKGPGRKKE